MATTKNHLTMSSSLNLLYFFLVSFPSQKQTTNKRQSEKNRFEDYIYGCLKRNDSIKLRKYTFFRQKKRERATLCVPVIRYEKWMKTGQSEGTKEERVCRKISIKIHLWIWTLFWGYSDVKRATSMKKMLFRNNEFIFDVFINRFFPSQLGSSLARSQQNMKASVSFDVCTNM